METIHFQRTVSPSKGSKMGVKSKSGVRRRGFATGAWTRRAGLAFLVVVLLAACASDRLVRTNRYPLPLEAAVGFLADSLYPGIRDHAGARFEPIRVVLDPFYGAETGQVLRVSRRIETLLLAAAGTNLSVGPMTPANVREADYALNGVIDRAEYRVADAASAEPYWRLRAVVVDLRDGAIAGQADAWVADRDLDVRPIAMHADSPVFFNNLSRKPRSGREYVDGLQAGALLAEAEVLYGRGDYAGAAALLRRIVASDAGPILKAWSGLYAAYRKLGDDAAMVEAFDRLVAVSVERYAVLTIKFLFQVNSTEFWPDPELRRQYAIWLERLGAYFREHPEPCLIIEGHCSRTGPETFNERLSLDRAQGIQRRLTPFFPAAESRTQAEGRGYSETILGTGTDDARDMIDRRVAFEIVDCDTLNPRRKQ